MTRALRLPRQRLLIYFVAIVLAVFFLVLWTFPTNQPGSVTLLTSEFLREYGYSLGSYDQRSAHRYAVIAVTVLSAFGFVAIKYRWVELSGRGTPPANLWLCLLATLVVYLAYRSLVHSPFNAVALILAVGFFIFVVVASGLKRHSTEVFALLVIGGYAAVLIVPGLLVWPIPLLQGDPNSLAQVELHLNTLTQPGVNIAAGQNFFEQIPFTYGVLMPSIMSIIDRRFGPLDIGDQIRFVQVCQVLFIMLAVTSYLCCRPRAYLGALAALLLAGPYWATAGLGEWHPNQTGFRALTLPIAMLALALAGRYHAKNAAWGLGATGGLSLLINLETTVAIGVGYLVYMSLRARPHLVVVALRMAAAGLGVIIAYLILYRLALRRLPFGGHPLSNLLMPLNELASGDVGLRLFRAGVWKENYYVVAFAFVMFIHAIYVVLDAFVRLPGGALPHWRAFRAAVGATLIVWFAYYFNLPNSWQIWTFYFLYGFLLIDLFEPRLFALGRGWQKSMRDLLRRPMRSRIVRIVPIIMLAFMVPLTNYDLIQYTKGFMYPPWFDTDHEAAVVSGILLPRAMADALKEKVAKLQEMYQATDGRIVYLTFNMSFVPMMSRIFMPAPERNLWSYIPGDVAFDRTIDSIIAKRPDAILIDAPTGPLAVPGARKDFQDHVRRSLSSAFHLAGTESGWQIWRPTPPS
jgi:hypothetical protein